MSLSTVVGANLSPMRGHVAKRFSTAMNRLMRFLSTQSKTMTVKAGLPAIKLFVKIGVPATNTAADSPGSDLCFIWDDTNADLYLAHTWLSATSFTILKVID